MPTINKKLLLLLLVAAIVLGAGVFAIHAVQSDRAIDALRWQAERAAERGKLEKAILYTRQYLEMRPDDHDALMRLAELVMKNGEGPRELAAALFLYERVLREAPKRDEVRRKLLDICLRMNRNSDAMIHARALLDKFPADSQLWENLGVAQNALMMSAEAKASFEKAIECDPSRLIPYRLLADLLKNQLNLKEQARALIDKMVRANPSQAGAYLIRASHFRDENKHAECMRDLERLLELDPENADGLLILAELWQGKDDVAKARAALTDGSSLHVKDFRFYRALSWLELAAGNVSAAIACLELGVLELPNSADLLTPLGDLLIQQGELDRVQPILRKLESQRAYATQLKYLRSRVLIQQGKYADAATMLERLRTEVVAIPGLATQVNLRLATCYERMANREAMIEALNRVLLTDTANQMARQRLGAMSLDTGDLDKAIADYAIAARSPLASIGARITLGRLLIARARSTNNSADWITATEHVDAVRKKFPHAVEPLLLMAESQVAHQQSDAARKLLRNEVGKRANDPRVWSVLASIALEEEGLFAALDLLDEAQSAVHDLGDQVELRLARARVWATDWQPGREERIRALGNSIESFTDSDQLQLLTGLADVCTQIRDFEGLKHFQRQIAAFKPRDVSIRRALYDVAIRTKDQPLTERIRRELSRIQGEQGTAVAIADALAAVDDWKSGDQACSQADALADRVLVEAPDRADAHLLKAKLAEKAGDVKAAAEHYAMGVHFETSLMQIGAQLSFLVRTGQDAAAKKRVEQLYYDPRMPGEGYLAMIEDVARKAGPERSEKMMSWVTPLLRHSGTSLLWAARLEQAFGRPIQAAALAARANVAAPKLADAWVAKIRFGTAAAEETLKSARRALDDRSYFVVCGEATADLPKTNPPWSPVFDKPEDRRRYAQARVNGFLLRGKRQGAMQVLSAMANDGNPRPEDVDWAKRNLAMLTAASGNIAERRMAIAELKDWKLDGNGKPDEVRSHVAALAVASRMTNGPERQAVIQKAIEVLKVVVAGKEAVAKDWYHLAQFCKLADDRPAYLEYLNEARKRDPDNTSYKVAYVDELLADGKLRDVEPFVAGLVEAAQDARAAASAARYYALSNLPSQSLSVVEHFMQSGDGGTADAQVRTRQAASMLDQLARLSVAKKLPCAKTLTAAAFDKYRIALRNNAEAASPMSALLAFDGRTSEALDLLLQHKTSLTAKVFTTAAVAVLRNGSVTPNQIQLVRRWLDDALAQQPDSVVVRMNLAELHSMREDISAAIKVYREVLKIEPDNIVALNNLAWMLSPDAAAADEALKCVDRAIELTGPNAELLDTRARIHISRRDDQRAIDDLRQALNQSQTSLRYFHLAMAQFDLSRKDEAAKSFKEARAHGLDPRTIHPNDLPMYRMFTQQMRE